MATGALLPADIGVENKTAPVLASSAYRSPLKVVVNTTSLVTVAAPYGEDGSGVSQMTVPVSWLTATISPTASSMAWNWLVIDPPVKPAGVAGSAKSLTAAKVVEPLLASWVRMPP